MKVLVVQHEEVVYSAAIEEWAERRGHQLEVLKVYEGAPFPRSFNFDAVVILGGAMGVNDKSEYSWIEKEEGWIRDLIADEVPLLGICLGSQLVASALGAKVHAMGYREMGWKRVSLTEEARQTPYFKDFPKEIDILSWHGDYSELPKGAVPLGTSEACQNQGFILGDKVLAVQFHPEANETLLTSFIDRYEDVFQEGGEHIQPPEEIRADTEKKLKEMNQRLFQWLDHIVAPDPIRF